jgi:hypothetical protein
VQPPKLAKREAFPDAVRAAGVYGVHDAHRTDWASLRSSEPAQRVMGQTPANIGFDLLNELAAIDEWCEALCRGGMDSELIRSADALEAAVTGNASRRALS